MNLMRFLMNDFLFRNVPEAQVRAYRLCSQPSAVVADSDSLVLVRGGATKKVL